MRIIYQSWIKREDLQANHDIAYLFGDNVLQYGMGGQAKEMRGERNAFGIPTKWEPTNRDEAFFTDDQFYTIMPHIVKAFREAIDFAGNNGHIIIIPRDGLGTGLAELPTRAPNVYEYIQNWIDGIKQYGNFLNIPIKI